MLRVSWHAWGMQTADAEDAEDSLRRQSLVVPSELVPPDVIVESRVMVEIKSNRQIIPHHTRQLLNYLKASKLEVGLLSNCGDRAEFTRVVNTRNPPR